MSDFECDKIFARVSQRKQNSCRGLGEENEKRDDEPVLEYKTESQREE